MADARALAEDLGAQLGRLKGAGPKVRELLAISQTEALIHSVLPTLLKQQKASVARLRPDIPEEVWAKTFAVAEEAFRESARDFVELCVPIYERNFSEEEIDGMLTFYRSPVGRSVVVKLPQVTQESLAAGQSWGLAVGALIARRVAESLAEEGYKI